MSMIDLGVQNLRYLKLQFSVNLNRWLRWLSLVRDGVQSCWLQHGDMEDGVDGMHTIRELEGKRV
jgi:hypothetical protein